MAEVSRIGNNINQIARRVNSNQNIYESDIQEIKRGQETLSQLVRELVHNTNKIRNI